VGQKEGEGIMFYPDGGKYIGQWKNDQPSGQGTYYYADGKILSGEWKNNRFIPKL
jgi:antitoxin component YwqK of YwqJK toxin-antitoxin module